MVTVIPTKEELPTPVKNGVTGGSSCDTERPFQFIKDYQEVDFHRTSSCKPLPEDLFETIDGQIIKLSIQGTFYVQIDALEPYLQIDTNQNDYDHILLTLTDGIQTIKAITMDSIPNLTFHTKIGSKLLLTDIIPIENNLLQLTHDNTKFQYGSNTYPRPRANNRNRASGSYNKSSYEGRRNSRYDNEDGENNFFKRPPPKNTLMDFMTSLKISNDNNENDKSIRRQSNGNNSLLNNEQILFQQDNIDESLNPEDDPTHANYRERRNPLPPRLQRAQEERSRRNTTRYYDETISSGNDLNSIYRNDTSNNPSLSSTSTSYIRHIDQPTYAYTQSINGSSTTHLTYFPTNPNSLTYISNTLYPNQQTLLSSSYTNEHYNYYPYVTNSTYLPTNFSNDSKTNGNIYLDNDENNDSGMKSETSSNEQKSTPPPPPLSLSSLVNDSNNIQEDKRRDSNFNSRPRWKIGDLCLARWSEDGEYYYANIVEIQPPYCTVLFRGYDTYDQVHFSDLKLIPRDQQQQIYSFIPPLSTDINLLTTNTYFQPRPGYYPSTIDGCIIMPEAPPFPFNSAGTLYMYPTHSNGYQQNDIEDIMINSTSSPSKDSNDTSTSNDENSFPQPCSIADAPLTLVTSDNFNNEQQLITTTKEKEEEEEIRE